jgi:hypothetical protein
VEDWEVNILLIFRAVWEAQAVLVVAEVAQPRADFLLLLVEYLSWVPRMAMTVVTVKAMVATMARAVVEEAQVPLGLTPQAN